MGDMLDDLERAGEREISMYNDWSGEVEETQASPSAISIIEGLLITSGISQKEKEDIDLYLDKMSEQDAYKTIRYLKEHETFNDPRDQYNNHLKRKL